MKPFQAVVMTAFVLLALFGIFIFATFTSSQSAAIGAVSIWGDMPQDVFEGLLGNARSSRQDFNEVTYKEVATQDLIPSLVAAIASGRGPDLVLFPSSSFVHDGDKIQPISYTTFARRDFQDQFVQAGEIFLTDNGVAALPMTIDPLVLYWNRTLFANAGVASPPRYWDELVTVAPKLTTRTQNGSLTQSAVALGVWSNVASNKGILITLMHELGSPVVGLGPDGKYQTQFNISTQSSIPPADSAVRFYTDFADPAKPAYSWNRSQKNSRDAFLAGTLALYIGPASDLLPLRAANPNLNFDVALLPVARGAGAEVYADVTALAIPRGAVNAAGAATVALELTNAANAAYLANELHLPAPRRDVEPSSAQDAYLSVFRKAGLKAFSFLDPSPVESDTVLGRMIEDVSSGRTSVTDATRNAQDELQQLLKVR